MNSMVPIMTNAVLSCLIKILKPPWPRDIVAQLQTFLSLGKSYSTGNVLLWTSPCSSPCVSVPSIWGFSSRSPQIFGTPQTSSNFHRFLRQLYKAPHQSIFYVLSHLQRLYWPYVTCSLPFSFLENQHFFLRIFEQYS